MILRSALGDSNGFKGDSKKDVSGMSDLFADNPARRNSVSRKAPEANKGVKKANESDVSTQSLLRWLQDSIMCPI